MGVAMNRMSSILNTVCAVLKQAVWLIEFVRSYRQQIRSCHRFFVFR